jgi:Mg2+/Co2+ transporter CorB
MSCIDKKILFLSTYSSLDKSFDKMKIEKNRIAVVREGKEILGIVTLQDILVSLVGKMTDEKDKLLPKKIEN